MVGCVVLAFATTPLVVAVAFLFLGINFGVSWPAFNALIAAIVQWTGQRKYTVDMLVRKLTLRCQALKLPSPRDPVALHMELAAYLSALVTNHLYTGKFKRSV